MQQLALFDDLIAMLITLVMSLAIPPVGSGAFWSIVAFYGVVSVLFDDETPRGVPGLEFLQRRHPQQQS